MAAKSSPKTKTKSKSKVTSTLAKSEDGTIQVTFTIPYQKIDSARKSVLEEMGKNIEVPGFRKGKAPIDKVAEHVSQDSVIQKTLGNILPKLIGDVIKEENLRPAIYPKFELLKAKDKEPWQVRATTCELPKVTLGDYKSKIKGAGKAKAIWTPDKGKPDNSEEKQKPKETTKAEKEQEVMKLLLESVKVNVPRLLIDEEVNTKLSQLLARIEKLGLSLESYLSSIGKNPQSLRQEYEAQARNSIALDLILSEIVNTEKISVDKSEVDAAVTAGARNEEEKAKFDTPDQRRIAESVLKRRKALDSLVSLL